LLARVAQTIIVIPGHTEGCIWELEWLKANCFLNKTVFLMPPEDSYWVGNADIEWEILKKVMDSLGIEMPPFSKKGALFKSDNLGRLLGQVAYDLKSAEGFVRALLLAEQLDLHPY
jgi:hypothetical protein